MPGCVSAYLAVNNAPGSYPRMNELLRKRFVAQVIMIDFAKRERLFVSIDTNT